MTSRDYEVDLATDPKGLIRVVRDELKHILAAAGATKIPLGEKKLRFYEWCLEHPEGLEQFQLYTQARRSNGGNAEAAFRATKWSGV